MRHYNASIAQWLLRTFRFKGSQGIDTVADILQPVVQIQPIINVCKRATLLNGTSSVVFATPADKDFYITGAMLSMIKDVASTNTNSSLNVTIDGVTVSLLFINGITLTAQSEIVSNSWPQGIKIDRGTNVTVTNVAGGAVVNTTATIQGFTVETSVTSQA